MDYSAKQIGALLAEIYSPNSIPAIPQEDIASGIANVELTDEERDAAIYAAKHEKYWRLQKERKEQIKKSVYTMMTTPWSVAQQLEFLYYRAQKLDIPKNVLDAVIAQNKEAVETLCLYFTNNPEFEQRGADYKLTKGIYLHGPMGTGKTMLMTLLMQNQKLCYLPIPAQDVVNLYRQDGNVCIQNMVQNETPMPSYATMYQSQYGRWFDDLGSEELEVSLYGNRVAVMTEVLLGRYQQRRKYASQDNRKYMTGMEYTHVTSNYGRDRILEKYGSRVDDRFNDMFNVITLQGSSLRGASL